LLRQSFTVGFYTDRNIPLENRATTPKGTGPPPAAPHREGDVN